jgi:hypothetical protein
MNWIDRYIYAVSRSLPAKQRADIEQELRGLIDDMLQKRVAGRPVIDADIEAVLQELGPPQKLAASYRGSADCLIGPALFDMYWLVLRIVLSAVGLGIAIAFVVRAASGPADTVWTLAGDFLSSFFSALVSAFGSTTLAFALIERFGQPAGLQPGRGESAWRLKDLPPVPTSSMRIPRSDSIAAIVFTLIFLLVINIDIGLIGLYSGQAGAFQITPLFSDVFASFLPWINLSLGISLLLESFKLILGRWNVWLLAGSAVDKIISLYIGLRLFADRAIFNADFFRDIDSLLAPAGKGLPANLPDTICKVLTVLIIFGFCVNMLTYAWKGVRLAVGQRD